MIAARGMMVACALVIATACEPASAVDPLPSAVTETFDPNPVVTTIREFDVTIPIGPPQPPLIEVVGDGFVDRRTGEPFVPRGVNVFRILDGPGGLRDRFFSTTVFNGIDVDDQFTELAALGYNTVRLFLDSCSVGPGCITTIDEPGLDDTYLANVAATMRAARNHGLMLVLTSNDLPDGGGYRDLANRDNSVYFPGYRNSDFLTPSGHEALRTYWTDLMTGLARQRAPFEVVLGWSILNEHWLFADQPPLSLTSGTVTTAAGTYDLADAAARRSMVVDTTRRLITVVASAITSIQPGANVTMGFFAPQFPNTTTIGGNWYVDTAELVRSSDLDFFDFHLYAGEDITVAQAAENFGITDVKPVVMGEYGAFVNRFPRAQSVAYVLQRHVAQSCSAGWDGWLQWGYLRSPLEDATWALTDPGAGLLMALAPRYDTDPCAVPENPNLAAGATITATSTLEGSDPANVADDGLAIWSAGADAPQSITIDLGAPTAVSSIELVVDQFPAGRTVHRLQWGVRPGEFSSGITFDGFTESADVLERSWGFERPTMRYIRITTDESPSWVDWNEIAVYGVAVP